jgi:hypothetical protein
MWSLPFNFCDQNLAHIFCTSHVCYMPCPSILLDLITLITFGEM